MRNSCYSSGRRRGGGGRASTIKILGFVLCPSFSQCHISLHPLVTLYRQTEGDKGRQRDETTDPLSSFFFFHSLFRNHSDKAYEKTSGCKRAEPNGEKREEGRKEEKGRESKKRTIFFFGFSAVLRKQPTMNHFQTKTDERESVCECTVSV